MLLRVTIFTKDHFSTVIFGYLSGIKIPRNYSETGIRAIYHLTSNRQTWSHFLGK